MPTTPAPTGAFVGHSNEIAKPDGMGGYTFTSPSDGQLALIHRGDGKTLGTLKFFQSRGLWLPKDTLGGNTTSFYLEGGTQSLSTNPPIEAVEFSLARLWVGLLSEPGTQGVTLEFGGSFSVFFSCTVTGRASGNYNYQIKIDKNGSYIASHSQLINANETKYFLVSWSGTVSAGDAIGFTVWFEEGVGGHSNEVIGLPRAMGWLN